MTCKHPDAPGIILAHGLHHFIWQSIGFMEYSGLSFLPSRQAIVGANPDAAIGRCKYGTNVIAGQTLLRSNSSDGEFSKPIKSTSSGHPDIPFTILKNSCDDIARQAALCREHIRATNMNVDQPPLVGSDPETSIAVPEQLVRMDVAVGQRRIGEHGAANRVGFESVTNHLPESSTHDPGDQPAVVRESQVGKPF